MDFTANESEIRPMPAEPDSPQLAATQVDLTEDPWAYRRGGTRADVNWVFSSLASPKMQMLGEPATKGKFTKHSTLANETTRSHVMPSGSSFTKYPLSEWTE